MNTDTKVLPGHVVMSQSYETLRHWLSGDVVGFVCAMLPRRIGARAFMTFLEYRHFPPGTDRNAQYVLVRVLWESMHWYVVIVPRQQRPLVDELCKELGLRIADGTPHVISSAGHSHFPVDVPNLFTLENVLGHFVYKNEPAQNKTAYDFEDEACDKVIAEHEARRNAEGGRR